MYGVLTFLRIYKNIYTYGIWIISRRGRRDRTPLLIVPLIMFLVIREAGWYIREQNKKKLEDQQEEEKE